MFRIVFTSQIIYSTIYFKVINFISNLVAYLVNLEYEIITSQ